MKPHIRLLAAGAALFTSAVQAQDKPAATGMLSYFPGAHPFLEFRSFEPCEPVYPAAALWTGAEGTTKLKLMVGESGRVESAVVIGGAGSTPAHKVLDQAALDALTGCALFKPPMDSDGHATTVAVAYDLRWSLRGSLVPMAAARPQATSASMPTLGPIDAACQPVYPPAAIRARATGTTKVRLLIDATGRAKSVKVVQSAGDSAEHKLLDQAAAEALPRCSYKPGTDLDGHAVDAMLVVTYRWKLEP